MSALFPETAELSIFITASILMGMTPGPDMLLVLNRSISIGFSAGMVTMAGIITGALCHTIAAAFGLSILLIEFPISYDIIRYAGAAYLIYLAWQIVKGGQTFTVPDAGNARFETPLNLFRQALLTNLLNPKVALFILAFLPQFIPPDAPNTPARIVILGIIFFGTGILIMTALAAIVGQIRIIFTRHPLLFRTQAAVTGCLLFLFALVLVFQGDIPSLASLSPK